MKKLCSFMLVLAMIAGLLPMGTLSVTAAESYKDWKQRDSRWSGYTMGSGGATVYKYGCISTALAMAAVRLGCENESTFNPGIFVKRVNALGGYTSGGAIRWNTAIRAVPNMSLVTDCFSSGDNSSTQRLNRI